jgi:hypothetical protein
MKVLFIGNSHVYMHFMPLMLEKLVKASDLGVSLVAEQCTGEGVSLEWHWKNSDTRDMLVSGNWDFVVLQDRAGGPLEETKSFETHARLLNQEIIAHGAQTVFYMTWALKSEPETQADLAQAYDRKPRRIWRMHTAMQPLNSARNWRRQGWHGKAPINRILNWICFSRTDATPTRSGPISRPVFFILFYSGRALRGCRVGCL